MDSRKRIAGGALLNSAGSIYIRVIGLVSITILSSILVPDDFGVVAIAVSIQGLAHSFINRQFHLALVRMESYDDDDLNTSFTLSATLGLFAGGMVALLGPVISVMMDDDRLTLVLIALGIGTFIGGLISPKFSRNEYSLNFLPIVIMEASSKTLAVVVSILLALYLENHWALVLGILANALTTVVISYINSPFLPTLTFTRWRKFLDFGKWLSGVGFLGYLNIASDNLAIGYFLSTSVAGIYHLGSELTKTVTEHLAEAFTRTLYAGLSRSDKTNYSRQLELYISIVFAVFLPIGTGFALCANEVVAIVLGENWGPAATVIMVVAPFYTVNSIGYVCQSFHMVEGDVKSLFKRNLSVLCVFLPLLIGLSYSFGLVGVLIARCAALTMQTIILLHSSMKLVGSRFSNVLKASGRSFLAVTIMALTVVLAERLLLSSGGFGIFIELAFKVSIGMLSYLSSHTVLWFLEGKPLGIETLILDYIRKNQVT